MKGNQAILHVCAGTHFCCGAKKKSDCTFAYFGKQLVLACNGICIVDVCNLICRNTFGNQFTPNIVIHVERTVFLRCRHITEDKLNTFLCFGFLPDRNCTLNQGVNFGVLIIGVNILEKSLIQSQLSAVIGDTQHIILAWINTAVSDGFCTLCKVSYKRFLYLTRFKLHIFIVSFRTGEIEHFGSSDVSHFFKQGNQFG